MKINSESANVYLKANFWYWFNSFKISISLEQLPVISSFYMVNKLRDHRNVISAVCYAHVFSPWGILINALCIFFFGYSGWLIGNPRHQLIVTWLLIPRGESGTSYRDLQGSTRGDSKLKVARKEHFYQALIFLLRLMLMKL